MKSKIQNVNPLLQTKPTSLSSFDMWKEKWDKATSVEERLGLLHTLIVSDTCWEQRKCVSFLLKIADGYNDQVWNFQLPEEIASYDMKMAGTYRLSIAQKAKSVLCAKFFSKRTQDPGRPIYAWIWMIRDEEIMKQVLDFFLSENKNEIRNFPSFGDTNGQETRCIAEFLKDFAHLGWDSTWHFGKFDQAQTAIKKSLISHRPEFVEILNFLGELEWLNTVKNYDAPTLRKLKEISLRKDICLTREFGGFVYRKPISIHEAVWGGSLAARTLAIAGIQIKEEARLQRAQKKLAEADEKRRALLEAEKLKKQSQELIRQAVSLQQKAASMAG